jgi:hypothetical protein
VIRHLPVVRSKAAIPISLPVPLASSKAVIQVPSSDSEVSALRLAVVIRLGARAIAEVVVVLSPLILLSPITKFIRVGRPFDIVFMLP